MEETRYFELPADPAGTVFDPADDTFGPIMAALQRGDFERARRLLTMLCERTMDADSEPLESVYIVQRDPGDVESLMVFSSETAADDYAAACNGGGVLGWGAFVLESEPVFVSAAQCAKWCS